MGFLIDGILASEHLDSSGESLSIAGCDLSSIHRGEGVVNFEHESKNPNQILGKILSAKKIFDEKDCEDDRQLYYWNKCKCPYIYILCELFDSEVSNHVASMFEYADQNKEQNTGNVLGFSIEGAKLGKTGMNITGSIARKATLTVAPCNKSCIAEMLPMKKQKSDQDSIFKTDSSITIDLTKSDVPGSKYPSAKNVSKVPKTTAPNAPKFGPMETKAKPESRQIGSTSSGKAVLSHAKPADYKGFTSKEHQEAGNIHHAHSESGKGVTGANHFDTAKRHMAIAGRGERQEATTAALREKAIKRPDLNTKRGSMKKSKLKKAMTAGSAMASPGNLEGGAALGKESLDKKMKKSSWLQRAEQEYQAWNKREEFENYMSKRMPHLTKGEIQSIGQTLALNKSLKAEKKLANMIPKPSKIKK